MDSINAILKGEMEQRTSRYPGNFKLERLISLLYRATEIPLKFRDFGIRKSPTNAARKN